MGILLYFKSRGFIGRIGTWAPLYLKGISFFLVQSAYSSTMDGLHGKYLQHSHRQENLCQRLKKNHQFWSTEPHSHVMTEDRGGTFSREAEVYITKTNLIQKKKYQSCRICYVGEKNISFSDSYIVLKVSGDHRQELTEHLLLEHGIPTQTPCPNS